MYKRQAYGIGLVFQVVDDVLDVTGTAEQLGKPIGSDSENGKTTFVTLFGVDGAMQLAEKDVYKRQALQSHWHLPLPRIIRLFC